MPTPDYEVTVEIRTVVTHRFSPRPILDVLVRDTAKDKESLTQAIDLARIGALADHDAMLSAHSAVVSSRKEKHDA